MCQLHIADWESGRAYLLDVQHLSTLGDEVHAAELAVDVAWDTSPALSCLVLQEAVPACEQFIAGAALSRSRVDISSLGQ